MTDAEYRALAERLANLDGDQADTALVLSDDASSAILALLEERDAKDAYIAARAHDLMTLADRATHLEECNDSAAATISALKSRLGKAVDLLQRTINGPADTHDKEWALFDETIAFLSDLEKSE